MAPFLQSYLAQCMQSRRPVVYNVSPAHYLVLDTKRNTIVTVKTTTASTKGKGKNKSRRNGSPRSELMAQPPTNAIATLQQETPATPC
jgi:hypothetical protein